MTPEFVEGLKTKALATFLRQDGVQADTAEVLKFEDSRYGGKYVIVRKADEVVAVYKMTTSFGPARGTRTEGGGVAYVVNSMSVGLKRIKRQPKGLLEQGKPVTA